MEPTIKDHLNEQASFFWNHRSWNLSFRISIQLPRWKRIRSFWGRCVCFGVTVIQSFRTVWTVLGIECSYEQLMRWAELSITWLFIRSVKNQMSLTMFTVTSCSWCLYWEVLVLDSWCFEPSNTRDYIRAEKELHLSVTLRISHLTFLFFYINKAFYILFSSLQHRIKFSFWNYNSLS